MTGLGSVRYSARDAAALGRIYTDPSSPYYGLDGPQRFVLGETPLGGYLDEIHHFTRSTAKESTVTTTPELPVFKHRDADGDSLHVAPASHSFGAQGPGEAAYVTAGRSGTFVAKDDAPAVAVAILKAAGHTGDSGGDRVAHAIRNLERELAERAEKEAAAADARKLDAEALELYRAAAVIPSLAVTDPARLTPEALNRWRRVARKARTLNAPKESA